MTNEQPEFSILHPTIRLPHGWHMAQEAWMDMASKPDRVEYCLILDAADDEHWPIVIPTGVKLVVNAGRKCYVDAQNAGAKWAHGRWLVCAADDWFPVMGWDEELSKLVPDPLNTQAVVNVVNGHHPTLIIYPIMTRAYYERPDRGGHPNGELFYPEYLSMGSDDDLTLVARRDGVVVESGMRFEHQHPWRGDASHDTHGAYAHVQSLEAWEVKDRVLPRRIAEGFAR